VISKTGHIQKKFPDKIKSLDLLMAKDADFLALCEDYEKCVDALHYWCSSDVAEAEDRVREYRKLILELEEEISGFLAGPKQRGQD
jgi:uncharacterized protein YdcH (DUF465 family)